LPFRPDESVTKPRLKDILNKGDELFFIGVLMGLGLSVAVVFYIGWAFYYW
jgi:hypothetical protein